MEKLFKRETKRVALQRQSPIPPHSLSTMMGIVSIVEREWGLSITNMDDYPVIERIIINAVKNN